MSIKSLIGLETVDSILSAFNVQHAALLAIAERQATKSAQKTDAAKALQLEAAALDAERTRALRVADRIANLVG